MVREHIRRMAITLCLVAIGCPAEGAAPDSARDAKAVEGLWLGLGRG